MESNETYQKKKKKAEYSELTLAADSGDLDSDKILVDRAADGI